MNTITQYPGQKLASVLIMIHFNSSSVVLKSVLATFLVMASQSASAHDKVPEKSDKAQNNDGRGGVIVRTAPEFEGTSLLTEKQIDEMSLEAFLIFEDKHQDQMTDIITPDFTDPKLIDEQMAKVGLIGSNLRVTTALFLKRKIGEHPSLPYKTSDKWGFRLDSLEDFNPTQLSEDQKKGLALIAKWDTNTWIRKRAAELLKLHK